MNESVQRVVWQDMRDEICPFNTTSKMMLAGIQEGRKAILLAQKAAAS